jgi:hypothetical protein
MGSTDGPLESAMIRCPAGHWFTGPIESFTCETKTNHHPGTTGAGSSARHDQPQDTHQGRPKRGGSAATDSPTKPEREARRPNGAPGHYLGRPAELWITAMRPRRGRTAPHLMEAGGRERTPFTYRSPFTGAHATTPSVPAARAR